MVSAPGLPLMVSSPPRPLISSAKMVPPKVLSRSLPVNAIGTSPENSGSPSAGPGGDDTLRFQSLFPEGQASEKCLELCSANAQNAIPSAPEDGVRLTWETDAAPRQHSHRRRGRLCCAGAASEHQDVEIGEREAGAQGGEPDGGSAARPIDVERQRAGGGVVDDAIVRILRSGADHELVGAER